MIMRLSKLKPSRTCTCDVYVRERDKNTVLYVYVLYYFHNVHIASVNLSAKRQISRAFVNFMLHWTCIHFRDFNSKTVSNSVKVYIHCKNQSTRHQSGRLLSYLFTLRKKRHHRSTESLCNQHFTLCALSPDNTHLSSTHSVWLAKFSRSAGINSKTYVRPPCTV